MTAFAPDSTRALGEFVNLLDGAVRLDRVCRTCQSPTIQAKAEPCDRQVAAATGFKTRLKPPTRRVPLSSEEFGSPIRGSSGVHLANCIAHNEYSLPSRAWLRNQFFSVADAVAGLC